jgi:hypothetical protein
MFRECHISLQYLSIPPTETHKTDHRIHNAQHASSAEPIFPFQLRPSFAKARGNLPHNELQLQLSSPNMCPYFPDLH